MVVETLPALRGLSASTIRPLQKGLRVDHAPQGSLNSPEGPAQVSSWQDTLGSLLISKASSCCNFSIETRLYFSKPVVAV